MGRLFYAAELATEESTSWPDAAIALGTLAFAAFFAWLILR